MWYIKNRRSKWFVSLYRTGIDPEKRPAEDLWRRTLSQIPTIYGRMAYLASLRNQNTGRYEHHGLCLLFGNDEADHALRESHTFCFRQWLGLNLENQKADLALYFTELPADRPTLVENWLRLAPYRSLVPSTCGDAEMELFLADLEAILKTLKNELAGGKNRIG